MRVFYLRVSSKDQNLDRQEELVKSIVSDGEKYKVFEEKVSGKNTIDRKVFKEMVDFVRDGDEVVVASIDRLARSLIDLNYIVKGLNGKGVSVRFVKENLYFAAGWNLSPMEKFMFNILGSFAEFERELILDRQREGIAVARAAGKYKRADSLNSDQVYRVRELDKLGVSKSKMAEDFGVARSTIRCAINGTGVYEKYPVDLEEVK